MMATLSSFIISNVGDGESIRLKWPRYTDEEAVYRVWRKEETKTILEGQDWKDVYDPVKTTEGYDYIACDESSSYVVFIDTKKKDDSNDQSASNYQGPKRGIVYDYKVEVVDKTTQEVLATYGTKDTDGDGEIDQWAKGVAEPFVMLVRGYGLDDKNYWNVFKDDMDDPIDQGGKGFRQTEQPYLFGGKTFLKPKTIWDTALSFEDRPEVYPVPADIDKGRFIGQAGAEKTGEALCKELKNYWLKSLKDGVSIEGQHLEVNRYDESGRLILNWIPEQIYVYSHSMGAPNSRYMEKLINQHRVRFEAGEEKETLPFVAKNVMLSPANNGSTLARVLRNRPDGWKTCFSEWISEKKKNWEATKFLQPEEAGKFNARVPSSDNTEYYFLGGHSWWRGGFGPGEKIIKNVMRFFGAYWMLVWFEADNYFSTEMKNDNAVTVKMQRGKHTDKVWNALTKGPVQFPEDTKYVWEFDPLPWQYHEQDTKPLNHYYGVMLSRDMIGQAWEQLDIVPKGVPPSGFAFSSTPHPVVNLFEDAYPQHNESGTLAVNEEQTFSFTVPISEKWLVTTMWESNDASFTVILIDPDGISYDGEQGGLPADIEYYSEEGGILYALLNPKIGTWQVTVRALNTSVVGDDFSVSFASETNFRMVSLFAGGEIGLDEIAQLNVALSENENPILNGVVNAVIIKESDNTQTVLSLYDDGMHGDDGFGDGIYGNSFNDTGFIEKYIVDYTANVVLSNNQPAVLKTRSGFEVVEKQIITIDGIVDERLVADAPPYEGFEVDVLVTFESPNPYVITAELFDGLGNHIAHGIGDALGDPGTTVTATIYFDGDDINASGVSGSFVVKHFFVTKTGTSDFGKNPSLEYSTREYQAFDFQFKDKDKDGLSDRRERELGTDWTLVDTDQDGMTDYQEVDYNGEPLDYVPGYDTDPLDPDTDRDTYLDGLDAFPLDPDEWSDRDGDGYGDNSDYDPDDPNVWENPNEPPVAVITGDTVYELESAEGSLIYLDGSQSHDPDEGDVIESYTWSYNSEVSNEQILNVMLPLGTHDVTLTVNDGDEDSEPAHVTVTVQDTTPPGITINSPESRTYGISEDDPVLDFLVFDLGGISELTATLNNNVIPAEAGIQISLAGLLGNEQNILQVTAKDPSNNEATVEVIFTVENSSSEIRKIVCKAVQENKMPRWLGRWVKVQLHLYDYFSGRAEFFESKGKLWLSRIFRRLAKRTLCRIIRNLNRHSRRVDSEVLELLILALEDLKN
jgi:hypothetical protein